MRIQEIALRRYRVPFRVPFATSHGFERYRRGTIVWITTDDGTVGLGEAAALPAFGTGTTEQIDDYLHSLIPQFQSTTIDRAVELLDGLGEDPVSAPARFALDTALLDIQAKQAGLPLSRFLEPTAASTVPVNATISDMDKDSAAAAASYAALAGYSAVKVKVGVLQVPGEEVERIAAIRQAVGHDIELRLDANGAWDTGQAKTIAGLLLPHDISYLEQPLPAADYEDMARLRRMVDIPIAADEGATTAASVRKIIQSSVADVVILKPGVIGGLRATREIIALARDAGLRIVITTALETGVAITAALHLAATLPKPVPACGLATGSLLETDLLTVSPAISRGEMTVPDGPGLGVELSTRDCDNAFSSAY